MDFYKNLSVVDQKMFIDALDNTCYQLILEDHLPIL